MNIKHKISLVVIVLLFIPLVIFGLSKFVFDESDSDQFEQVQEQKEEWIIFKDPTTGINYEILKKWQDNVLSKQQLGTRIFPASSRIPIGESTSQYVLYDTSKNSWIEYLDINGKPFENNGSNLRISSVSPSSDSTSKFLSTSVYGGGIGYTAILSTNGNEVYEVKVPSISNGRKTSTQDLERVIQSITVNQ